MRNKSYKLKNLNENEIEKKNNFINYLDKINNNQNNRDQI